MAKQCGRHLIAPGQFDAFFPDIGSHFKDPALGFGRFLKCGEGRILLFQLPAGLGDPLPGITQFA
jgi:hypothetical protein